MFNTLIESSLAKDPTRKRWSVIVSAFAEVVVVSCLILIPLIYTQALPKAMPVKPLLITPLASPEPQPQPMPMQQTTPSGETFVHRPLVTPAFIPQQAQAVAEPEFSSVPAGDAGPDSLLANVIGPTAYVPNIPEAKAPAPPEPAAPQRIQRGGTVQEALLISQSKPVYPALAIHTRTQGSVVLHAIIDKEGRVSELRVISGHPLLMNAALDAVRQWRYHPTLLNGVPVEVDTTITVTFTLAN